MLPTIMGESEAVDGEQYMRLRRLGGLAVLVGVLGVVLHRGLDTRLPPGPSGPGDVEGLLARATHPI